MSDEKYVLPNPPSPELSEARPHRMRIRLDAVAIGVAGLAAIFSLLQWRAGDRQADIAQRALTLAEATAKDQIADIQRARKAAEESQASAANLARSNETIAETQNRSLGLAEQQFSAFRQSVGQCSLFFTMPARVFLATWSLLQSRIKAEWRLRSVRAGVGRGCMYKAVQPTFSS